MNEKNLKKNSDRTPIERKELARKAGIASGKARIEKKPTCQGTMPVVFGIINKANSFEEAIRYAVAVGGDSDTIGAIVGSIAEAIWGIPEHIYQKTLEYLPVTMNNVIGNYFHKLNRKHNEKQNGRRRP